MEVAGVPSPSPCWADVAAEPAVEAEAQPMAGECCPACSPTAAEGAAEVEQGVEHALRAQAAPAKAHQATRLYYSELGLSASAQWCHLFSVKQLHVHVGTLRLR